MTLPRAARMNWPPPSPNPFRQRRATIRRARTAAAAAVLFSTTLVLSASASQQQSQAGDTVRPGEPLGYPVPLSTGGSIPVIPVDRNDADPGIEDDFYVYPPPLSLERDPAGHVEASVTHTGRVRVRLRGASRHITDEIHAWLVGEGLLPAARRSGVLPLEYSRIRILDADSEADARWEAVYPPDANATPETPAPQDWITFVFAPRDGVTELPDDFIARLNDPDRLPSFSVVLSYGGRIQELDSLILNASTLRGTDFLVELRGDGGRGLVTRRQARDLLSEVLTEVSQIIYIESVGPVNLENDGWLDSGLFQRVTISGEDFWSKEDNLRRVGFSGEDLDPDTHSTMREKTASELQDESRERLSEETSSYWKRWTAGAWCSIGRARARRPSNRRPFGRSGSPAPS